MIYLQLNTIYHCLSIPLNWSQVIGKWCDIYTEMIWYIHRNGVIYTQKWFDIYTKMVSTTFNKNIKSSSVNELQHEHKNN